MNIVAFLHARLDEDEAAAREATVPLAFEPHAAWRLVASSPNDMPGAVMAEPARVLAEVEAKRRIVGCAAEQPEVMGEVVAHLAEVYAGHPDYDEEWRP